MWPCPAYLSKYNYKNTIIDIITYTHTIILIPYHTTIIFHDSRYEG